MPNGFRRTTVAGLLCWALLVASVDVLRLLTFDDEAGPGLDAPVALPPAPATGSAAPTDAVVPPPPTPTGTAAPGTASSVGAGANVTTPGGPSPPTTEPAAPALDASVTCQSDLPLAASPDAPYNFLCTRDGTPLSWAGDHINVYSSGLTPLQVLGLQSALAQWHAQGRFTVTQVNSAAAADVTIGTAPLSNSEGGHASVSYTCTTVCAFDHAHVDLSSTLRLDQTLWVTTILHELGHVAGLNHVSRPSEVMHPEIGVDAPLVYSAGDVAGFQELARIRDSYG